MTHKILDGFGRRGVSEVIGSLLIFALVILLLGVIQVTLVPENVADREFEHSKEVEGDLNQLAATISEVRSSGNQQSTAVSLSPQYGSTSAFLIYPSEPRGMLQTSSSSELRMGNLRAVDGEARDYWDVSAGSPIVYDTRILEYQIEYNRFRGTPTYKYNQGVLAKQFDTGDTIIAAGQSPIQGRHVLLTLIKGQTTVSSDTQTSVNINPGSAGTTFTPVQSQSGELELTLPTDLSEGKWCEILSAEIRQGSTAASTCGISGTADGNIVYLDGNSGQLSLALRGTDAGGDKITYLLDISTVSINERASDPGPQYIVEAENIDRQIAVGTEGTLGARVLDKYGNPVSGVDVQFRVKTPPSGTFNAYQTVTTNENGYAKVSFTPAATGTYQIKAEFNGGTSDQEEAIYTFNSLDPSTTSDAGLLDNGRSAGISVTGASVNSGAIDVQFTNIGSVDREISEAQVSFYYKSNANNIPTQVVPTWDDGSSPPLEVSGDYEVVDEEIEAGDSETYSFNPDTSAQNGDFLIINLKYESDQSATYIVVATP